MKTSALFCLLLFAFTAFAASQPELDLSCREYKLDPKMGPEKLIAYDLTHGLWFPEGKDATSLQFNEDGTAILFSEENGNTLVSFIIWSVSSVDDLPQLSTISSADGSLQEYVVTSYCEGMHLLNTTTWEMQKFLYRPMAAASKLNELKANLYGEWTAYPSQPRFGQPQAVRFNFDEDQQFTRMLDMGGTEIPESGVWELAKDGNFMLLHTSKRNQPTVFESTTVYQLVYCDDHSLQLKSVTLVPTNEKVQKPQPEGLLSFIK